MKHLKYNIVYALWIMFPSSVIGVFENLGGVLTLGFWNPSRFQLMWMCYSLDNFPTWAGAKEYWADREAES